jgi:TonB family protein
MKTQPALPLGLALLLGGYALSQNRRPQPPLPSEFLIGRHTYFDFGPPMDYYELFLVRATTNACLIERITITPAGAPCVAPPSVVVTTGRIEGSMRDLLGKNPCLIPARELHREQDRCKNCLSFGGAEVTMQVPCGDQTRKIRMDILDRDMFDPNPGTPQHTSWTMSLLDRLDAKLGDRVMDRPMIDIAAPRSVLPEGSPDPVMEEIQSGKYDDFFGKAPDKLSQLAHDAQIPLPIPTVELLNSSPFRPIAFDPPAYPMLAKLARVEGEVTVRFAVDAEGGTENPEFLSGPRLLRGTVEQTVAAWKFSKEAAGQQVQATLIFKTNCQIPHP